MSGLEHIHKIAVLRATNLGDYVAAIPALEALKNRYADAEIVYLGRPLHQAIVEHRPGPVDRVIVIPVSQGIRHEPHMPHLVEDQRELAYFFEHMQQEQFDLAIQMHGGGKNSNPFVKRLGARITLGMKAPDAPELDRWIPYVYYQNEFARLAELVRLIGAQTPSLEPKISVTATDSVTLRQVLPQLIYPIVVLHPGATDMRRRWPPERFAAVGDRLTEAGFQVVITGVSHEQAVVEQVIQLMKYPAVNSCGLLPLGGLIALLASASLVISNDTGPLHLANAVGTPNVGIFWCGNYLIWSHLDRTRHRPLASWTLYCPLCGTDMSVMDPPRDQCLHDTCFVAGITVEEVLTQAFDLLHYAEQYLESEGLLQREDINKHETSA